jgi:hypothetical protein
MALMRAECTTLMVATARLPARSELASNQFEHPMAIGRIWFSTQLM